MEERRLQEEIDLLDGVIDEIEDKIEETVATPDILFRKASRVLSSD